jgi:hypothetical protein
MGEVRNDRGLMGRSGGGALGEEREQGNAHLPEYRQ